MNTEKNRISNMILYQEAERQTLVHDFILLSEGYLEQHDKQKLAAECFRTMVLMAEQYGFYGNLWHMYLTYLIVNDENPYSKSCEIRGAVNGSVNVMAQHDFKIWLTLFRYDFQNFGQYMEDDVLAAMTCYEGTGEQRKQFNQRIRDQIHDLSVNLSRAADTESFAKEVTAFYQKYGVGNLGLHKAFRIRREEKELLIAPISNIAHVRLEDLVGYELQKKKLTDNTEAFINGKKANNCLLFGDAGTGKSSSIKAIANQYYDQGLRIIEVYKHQFQDLNDLMALLKNRNYKFIIYMDDLSFEEFEIEYKYLKAVIEGGLEKKPENILIYATSNRRHLVREKFSDKAELADDLHNNDTVQEKLSLVARFGVTIYFGSPEKKEFQQIVKTLAKKHELDIPEEKLLAEANKWELSHGGLSGRTAQQFIDYLAGQN